MFSGVNVLFVLRSDLSTCANKMSSKLSEGASTNSKIAPVAWQAEVFVQDWDPLYTSSHSWVDDFPAFPFGWDMLISWRVVRWRGSICLNWTLDGWNTKYEYFCHPFGTLVSTQPHIQTNTHVGRQNQLLQVGRAPFFFNLVELKSFPF